MVERCPACRAKEPGVDVCRRCHAELHWLTRIHATVQHEEGRVVQYMLHNKMAKARSCLQRTVKLKDTELTRALLGFLEWKSHTSQRLEETRFLK